MKRIKVTHILYSFEVGGIESLVLQFCNLMNEKEYEFHIVTLTNEDLQMVNLLPFHVKVHSLNLKKSEIKSVRGLFIGLKELVKLLMLLHQILYIVILLHYHCFS